jgi:hypothetical protein
MAPSPIDLSVREPASRLLDEPFVLRARADRGDVLTWRARLRDDDGRVWKAVADAPAGLATAWTAAKAHETGVAALGSLRPVTVDVRVEAADGRAAGRKVTRILLADGVKARRWRDGLSATVYLPADPVGTAALVPPPPDTAGAAPDPAGSLPVAALLASRGVASLVLVKGDLDDARERLAALPAVDDVTVLDAAPAPPNTGAHADAAAWDALLERLRARPRETA